MAAARFSSDVLEMFYGSALQEKNRTEGKRGLLYLQGPLKKVKN